MDLDPATLCTGLLISAVGTGLFLYGKKQARVPQIVAGLLLIVLPVAVPGALCQLGAAALVIAGVWFAVRSGR